MVMKERDEELALFLEMRRREKENEKNNLLILQNSDDLGESNLGELLWPSSQKFHSHFLFEQGEIVKYYYLFSSSLPVMALTNGAVLFDIVQSLIVRILLFLRLLYLWRFHGRLMNS